jgi:hypothetical protein
MAKAAFNKTKTLFTSKLELKLRKKLLKCYIRSITLLGAEKDMESFKTWCWRRMKKMSWADRVRNEEVLQTVKGRHILQTVKRRKGKTELVISCVGTTV